MDVEALYPSILINRSAVLVGEMVQESEVKIKIMKLQSGI